MILPTSLALVSSTFAGKERGQAFAVWGSTIGAAAAIGPLLGGALAEVSWRWAFGVNIPLGVLIFFGVRVFLAPSPRTSGGVDLPGAVLSVVGLGLLAFALIEGRTYGWTTTVRPLGLAGLSWDRGPSPVLVALLVAAVALIAFVRRQSALSRGGGAEPLMDVRLFAIRSFRNGNIATLIIGLGEFGIVAVLPLWLQFTLDYSPLQAGLALLTLAVGSFVASGASFGMTTSVSPLGLVRLGLALEIAGLAGLGLFAAPDSSWWSIALTLTLFLFGVGVGFAQVTNVALADVPGPSAGQGSGIQSAARQLGSALGIAVLTTVFYQRPELRAAPTPRRHRHPRTAGRPAHRHRHQQRWSSDRTLGRRPADHRARRRGPSRHDRRHQHGRLPRRRAARPRTHRHRPHPQCGGGYRRRTLPQEPARP